MTFSLRELGRGIDPSPAINIGPEYERSRFLIFRGMGPGREE